jgi:hypothetical protein
MGSGVEQARVGEDAVKRRFIEEKWLTYKTLALIDAGMTNREISVARTAFFMGARAILAVFEEGHKPRRCSRVYRRRATCGTGQNFTGAVSMITIEVRHVVSIETRTAGLLGELLRHFTGAEIREINAALEKGVARLEDVAKGESNAN